jgi:hypothetical protein
MRNSVALRLAGAAAFAILSCSVVSSPVAAFGFSDRQADEIAEFIKCKTYLLKGDLASFRADPDCGKGPVVFEMQSLGVTGSGPKKREDHCYEWPSEGYSLLVEDGGEY